MYNIVSFNIPSANDKVLQIKCKLATVCVRNEAENVIMIAIHMSLSDDDDFRYTSYPKFHSEKMYFFYFYLPFFFVAGQDGPRYWRDSQGYTSQLEKL